MFGPAPGARPGPALRDARAEEVERRLSWLKQMEHDPSEVLADKPSETVDSTASIDEAARRCAADPKCVAVCRSTGAPPPQPQGEHLAEEADLGAGTAGDPHAAPWHGDGSAGHAVSGSETRFYHAPLERGFEEDGAGGAWQCLAVRGEEPGAAALGPAMRGCFQSLSGESHGLWNSSKILRNVVRVPGEGDLKLMLPLKSESKGSRMPAAVSPPQKEHAKDMVLGGRVMFAQDAEEAKVKCAEDNKCGAFCFHEQSRKLLLYGNLAKAQRHFGKGRQAWQHLLEPAARFWLRASAHGPPPQPPRELAYELLGQGACLGPGGNATSSYYAKHRPSKDSCEALCSKHSECLGYSWNPTEGLCTLNVSRQMTSPEGIKDFSWFGAANDDGTGAATDVGKADGTEGFECFKKGYKAPSKQAEEGAHAAAKAKDAADQAAAHDLGDGWACFVSPPACRAQASRAALAGRTGLRAQRAAEAKDYQVLAAALHRQPVQPEQPWGSALGVDFWGQAGCPVGARAQDGGSPPIPRPQQPAPRGAPRALPAHVGLLPRPLGEAGPWALAPLLQPALVLRGDRGRGREVVGRLHVCQVPGGPEGGTRGAVHMLESNGKVPGRGARGEDHLRGHGGAWCLQRRLR
ncbi:unnamed protein product, partial [Prorocentrum cordatum]